MKTLLSLVAAACCLAAAAQADPRPEPLAEVMLVGVYHMHNPGADQFNMEADDVLSDRRQGEIAAMTERLAAWGPDLVMVEWTRENTARTAAEYAEYRDGGQRDSRNEVVQLGFRLADRLDHDRIASIDVQTPFFAEEHGAVNADPDARVSAINAEIDAYGNWVIGEQGRRLAESSIGDFLAWMNSPEALTANHDFYMRHLIRVWQGENQGAAHTIANWYERNILIFQNILREVEESDGRVRRVVVFYGQGHIPTIAQMVRDTPWLTLADPLPYLAD